MPLSTKLSRNEAWVEELENELQISSGKTKTWELEVTRSPIEVFGQEEFIEYSILYLDNCLDL